MLMIPPPAVRLPDRHQRLHPSQHLDPHPLADGAQPAPPPQQGLERRKQGSRGHGGGEARRAARRAATRGGRGAPAGGRAARRRGARTETAGRGHDNNNHNGPGARCGGLEGDEDNARERHRAWQRECECIGCGEQQYGKCELEGWVANRKGVWNGTDGAWHQGHKYGYRQSCKVKLGLDFLSLLSSDAAVAQPMIPN